MQKRQRAKQALKHLGKVAMGILSASLMVGPAGAKEPSEAASQVVASKGGKEVINSVLKVARSKPSLSLGTAIICLSCIPIAGGPASASMCVACGILITKMFG